MFAVYPCDSPYCPYTPPGFQTEDFKLKSNPVICEIEPNDTRFPNLAQTVITTTHQAVKNWTTLLNSDAEKNSTWDIDEIIIPPGDKTDLDPACNIAIVYESQELDYCGQVFNGVYFPCGQIFNGKSILNPDIGTSLILIPYLMPIYGKQCEYEKNGTAYDSICRSQQEIESHSSLLKAIQHEMGHSMGLGHFIANSQDEVDRWFAGTQSVPSIMVSGQEGYMEYAKVTPLDASQVRDIYGKNGFKEISTVDVQNSSSLRLQIQSHVPSWIKNVTDLWLQEKITDLEFEDCIKYLPWQGVISIHNTIPSSSMIQEIPSWVKDIVKWWSIGQTDDTYFTSIAQWIIQTRV